MGMKAAFLLGVGWWDIRRIVPRQVGIQGPSDDLGHRQTFALSSQCQLPLLACRDIDVDAYFVHLVPPCLTYSIIMTYNEDSRETTKGQEARCRPTNTKSTEHPHNMPPSRRPSAPCNSSATSVCASGWILAGPPRTICNVRVLSWPTNTPLPAVSTPRPVKPQQIVHGLLSRGSMTIAASTNQARRAIPSSSTIIDRSSTKTRAGK